MYIDRFVDDARSWWNLHDGNKKLLFI